MTFMAAEDLGDNFIGIVDKNTKKFHQETIEGLMKDWARGLYLKKKSQPSIPVEDNKIAIVQKQNYRKVFSFISIDGPERTAPGVSYSTGFPDIFSEFPLVMYPS